MARERKGKDGQAVSAGRGTRRNPSGKTGRRTRPRHPDQPELELSPEELRALADEGIDPDDVHRLAHTRRDPEASDHDRDTARDDLEGLVIETEEDYQ
jgi:hypothetical protein